MFIKILCYALVSAVLVQSLSTLKPTEEVHEGKPAIAAKADGGGKEKGGIGEELKDMLAKSKARLKGFFKKLHEAADSAIEENVSNFGREVDSINELGNATLNAVKTIIDAKIKLLKSIPNVGIEALKELKKDE